MRESHDSQEQSLSEQAYGCVIDLGKKINFLIDEHHGRRIKVRTRPEFDAALGIHETTRIRWVNSSRIPKLGGCGPKIAYIFDISEMSFRVDPFPEFKKKCQMEAINWGRVLAYATPDLMAVKPVQIVSHKADLMRELSDELTVLVPLQAFTVKLPSDPDQIDTAWWGNWHVLLFSGDRDGYLNWLPRHKATQEFGGKDRFPLPPVSRSLTFPRAGGDPLRIGNTASGEHDIVMIVSEDRIPSELEVQFEKKLYNAQLQPFLDELAVWLFPRLENRKAAVVRALYFVGNPTCKSGPLA